MPLTLPQVTQVVCIKQYQLLGSHEETGPTILKLEDAEVICLALIPFTSPVWLVWKLDRTSRMTMGY